MRKKSETQKMTTIKVSLATRDALLSIGKKGETYEQVLLHLLALWSSTMSPKESKDVMAAIMEYNIKDGKP